jgi:hypothetical protein
MGLIADLLPKPQVQTPQFKVHISYFLQKCKKANPKMRFAFLIFKNTTFFKLCRSLFYCRKHKFGLVNIKSKPQNSVFKF